MDGEAKSAQADCTPLTAQRRKNPGTFDPYLRAGLHGEAALKRYLADCKAALEEDKHARLHMSIIMLSQEAQRARVSGKSRAACLKLTPCWNRNLPCSLTLKEAEAVVRLEWAGRRPAPLETPTCVPGPFDEPSPTNKQLAEAEMKIRDRWLLAEQAKKLLDDGVTAEDALKQCRKWHMTLAVYLSEPEAEATYCAALNGEMPPLPPEDVERRAKLLEHGFFAAWWAEPEAASKWKTDFYPLQPSCESISAWEKCVRGSILPL